jgi:hypothetical protein
MKLKPFLSIWWSRFFIGTVILSVPYWIVEIYANFTYFHNVNKVFLSESLTAMLPEQQHFGTARVSNMEQKPDLGKLSAETLGGSQQPSS